MTRRRNRCTQISLPTAIYPSLSSYLYRSGCLSIYLSLSMCIYPAPSIYSLIGHKCEVLSRKDVIAICVTEETCGVHLCLHSLRRRPPAARQFTRQRGVGAREKAKVHTERDRKKDLLILGATSLHTRSPLAHACKHIGG